MNTAATNGLCSPIFKNCVFFQNQAGISGVLSGLGGAIANAPNANENTDVIIFPSFVNCVFCQNKAFVTNVNDEFLGGGVMGSLFKDVYSNCTPNFMNCTFFENAAIFPDETLLGGIMFSSGDVQTSITNSIFWQENLEEASALIENREGAITEIAFSDFNLTNVPVNITESGVNLNQNPLFKGTTNLGPNTSWFTYSSGLALQKSSPCKTAGTTDRGVPTTDITGTIRTTPPSMGAYDVRDPGSIIVQEPGQTEVTLPVPPDHWLKTLTIAAKGADGGDLFDTNSASASAIRLASGGKGATLEVTYERDRSIKENNTLNKIQAVGGDGKLIVNVGASLQAVTLTLGGKQKIVCTAIGGGPTTVFIPNPGVKVIDFKASTLEESVKFLRDKTKVVGPLILVGGGGGGSRGMGSGQNGGDGKGTLEDDPKIAGEGASPFGPGGGAALEGAGMLCVQVDVSKLSATIGEAGADGGDTTQGPQGMLSLLTSDSNQQNYPASRDSGYYIGGVAGMEVILENNSRVPAGTFGGGGGAGWSGGNGADLRAGTATPSQGGTSYIDTAFGGTEVKSAKSSSIQSSEIVVSQAEENITSADFQTEAQEIVIQQNESLELLTFINAIIKLLNTGSIATIRDLFFNSNALGVTNERDRQGYVIISYTTEPIPPVPPVPPVRPAEVQEKEIVSTNLVYDWNITTSSHNVKLDFEDED